MMPAVRNARTRSITRLSVTRRRTCWISRPCRICPKQSWMSPSTTHSYERDGLIKKTTCATASCALRPGRKPYECGEKSASKDRFEHQSERHLHNSIRKRRDAQFPDLPASLGDRAFRGTGCGRYERSLSWARRLVRNAVTPSASICSRVTLSTPGVLVSPVGLDQLPRCQKRGVLAHEIEHVVKHGVLVLACPSVVLALPSMYPIGRSLAVGRRERVHARPPL